MAYKFKVGDFVILNHENEDIRREPYYHTRPMEIMALGQNEFGNKMHSDIHCVRYVDNGKLDSYHESQLRYDMMRMRKFILDNYLASEDAE